MRVYSQNASVSLQSYFLFFSLPFVFIQGTVAGTGRKGRQGEGDYGRVGKGKGKGEGERKYKRVRKYERAFQEQNHSDYQALTYASWWFTTYLKNKRGLGMGMRMKNGHVSIELGFRKLKEKKNCNLLITSTCMCIMMHNSDHKQQQQVSGEY